MIPAFGKRQWGVLLTSSSLNPALAQKFGYDSSEELFKGAQEKFSLVSTGIVEKPSCRLLLINVSYEPSAVDLASIPLLLCLRTSPSHLPFWL